MPNIIEQQDILKGLPDARLAMLLQNPVGDIPPFLVAAEAQRREAIRQQFAGQPPKESVVESLTKQLARVPQNIQAPAQMPPMVPPTPQMAGVAALEQQQMMEQAAMNAQPQQMRHGGMVRRFNTGGKVDPLWEIPDLSGAFPSFYDWAAPKVKELADFATTSYSDREKQNEEEKEEEKERIFPRLPKEASGGMSFTPRPPKPTMVNPNAGTPPPEPEPGETEDEFRARIEELYAANEPSDWEKSQRWFAMAEQFLDPSKTTMQSVAGAGRAFADQSAAMAAAERQAQREAEKALLEYDMSQYKSRKDAEREAAIAERSRTSMSAEKYADVLSRRLDAIDKIIESKAKQITDSAMPLTPEEQAQINAEIQKLNLSREQVAGLLASLGEASYGPVPYETYNLGKGFRP